MKLLPRFFLAALLALGVALTPASSAPTPAQALSQLGRQYTITAAETSAGLVSGTTVGTICNLGFAPYNVNRYCADPTGASTSVAAFNAAYNAALANTPHAAVYIPHGTYLIPSPGLSWGAATGPGQNDIRVYGDGPNDSVLLYSGSNYTVLTISADNGLGGGTVGTNLVLSNFGISAGLLTSGTGVSALSLADYLFFKLENMQLYCSANCLKMAGMAQGTITNINANSGGVNAAGNAALLLTLDTGNVPNGPLTFNSSFFEGESNVTAGGAVWSQKTFATQFNTTTFIALGPAVTSVFEATNNEDITIVGGYSESARNTTANTADLFKLGATAAVQNFSIIGGTYFSGASGHFLAHGVNAVAIQAMTVKDATFAGFTTAAIKYVPSTASMLEFRNVYSTGTGNPPVFDPAVAGTPPTQYLKSWSDPWPRLDASLNTGVSSVTGDGTAYTVLFDTANIDTTTMYAAGTGIATVPGQGAGMYDVSASIVVNGLTASDTGYQMDIVQKTAGGSVVTDHAVNINPGAVRNAANQATLFQTVMLKCAGGDQIFVQITVSGSTKTVGVAGAGATEFTRMTVRYIG